MTEYEAYIQSEWELFTGDPMRAAASLEAVRGLEVNRVLDVGCGGGQELLPFVTSGNAFGVGIDIAPEVGRLGRKLFAGRAPEARVCFVRAAGESLPFPDNSFDVVICRVALPYMDNARALGEMARVLRPGGAFLLKIHHARYYLRKLRGGLRARQPLSMIHAARVLLSGTIYHATRRQPRSRIPSPETFQSVWLLRRELARRNLFIDRELPDGDAATPSFVIIKEGTAN
ncbi:MAG TPA: class I SAM-dependent methyltransferase [Pyrinomonadaceae bacterium]|jgi:SAM-dependent methyltransferase|nr:class I SAM-dependent methyltransferase [Pyrinomonadaceae bacterium]